MIEENQQHDVSVTQLTAHYMRYKGGHYFRIASSGGAVWSIKDATGNLVCESTEKAAILEAALHDHLSRDLDALIDSLPAFLREQA